MTTNDIWEFVDQAPDYAKNAAALWEWSTNCEFPTPFGLFCDLTGISETEFGQKVAANIGALGYIEMDYLGEALTEFAQNPVDVMKWVLQILALEANATL